ncbi:MAG: energy transducer TonB [Bacteroidota bacterium]
MSDSYKHIIYTETDCLSEQTMFDYIDKKLSAKDCHVVEKHLLHCDLCSDALEGLELTKNRGRIESINQQVRERIANSLIKPKANTFNYKLIISIAATVLLLIGGVFLFKQFNQNNKIAEFKSESAAPLSEVQPAPVEETLSDSTAVNVPPIPAGKGQAEAKPRLEVKSEAQPAQPITASKQQALPKSITNTANTEDAVGGVSMSRDNAEMAKEEEKQMESPEQLPSVAADDFSERKTTKNSEESNKKVNTRLTQPSPAKAGSASPQEREDSDQKKDDGAKTTSNYNDIVSDQAKSKKRSKEKTKTEKSNSDESAYAPQSIVLTDESVELATAANSNSESMPEFPGGQDALRKFIAFHFKYPENSKKEDWIGQTIYVSFIVNGKGKIGTPKILKGINSDLDKEALRVVNSMPNWKPAIRDGEPTSVNYNLPIKLE